jgi:peptidoglycan/xylan/chitin deacetylase (PgdA/CDA1 family)
VNVVDSVAATVCLTFDFDAISLWIGPFGATSPSTISRGEFGAVGARRILRLLDRAGIQASFFVTGHTAETYPEIVREIAAAGHEIGHHGYLHENPIALGTREREREVLLMASDFTPYWCRVGDAAPKDGPYTFGAEVDLVEMPVSWILDDFPHFENVRLETGLLTVGLSAASKVEEIWRGEFDFMYREVPGGVLTITMHPQVIGRGHRMLMLERLIEYFRGHDGVRFTTLGDAAEAFRATAPGPRK